MSRLMQRNWAKGVGPELDLAGLKIELTLRPSSSC